LIDLFIEAVWGILIDIFGILGALPIISKTFINYYFHSHARASACLPTSIIIDTDGVGYKDLSCIILLGLYLFFISMNIELPVMGPLYTGRKSALTTYRRTDTYTQTPYLIFYGI